MDKYDLALLIVRIGFGLSMMAHGWNKFYSASGIDGTTGWFSSIGMKWPAVQSRVAATSELAAGSMMAAGLFTTVSSAVFISLMVVAIVTVHWRVGYFIFLPNGGWEYCASIIVVASAVAVAGPGSASLDHLWNIPSLPPVAALALGIVAPVCHLALSYRPPSR